MASITTDQLKRPSAPTVAHERSEAPAPRVADVRRGVGVAATAVPVIVSMGLLCALAVGLAFGGVGIINALAALLGPAS